jgi:hypothetical protein
VPLKAWQNGLVEEVIRQSDSAEEAAKRKESGDEVRLNPISDKRKDG